MSINNYTQINSNKMSIFPVQAENQKISSLEQTSENTKLTYCRRLCQAIACCFTAVSMEDTKKTVDDVATTRISRLHGHESRNASSTPLLQSPLSPQRKEKEILLRIHSVDSSSKLFLLYFRPGKTFFLIKEDADVLVKKFSVSWKITKFNHELEEGLQKRIMNKVIQALKKTNIKVLLLPQSCENIVPSCDGLTLQYFR